jgi:hypothetical protein
MLSPSSLHSLCCKNIKPRTAVWTNRVSPEKHVHPSRLIIWCPLKPIFFELFWPRTGLKNLSDGACPNCR